MGARLIEVNNRATQARGRRHVDHPAPVPLDHSRQEGPGAEEGAGGVDGHEPVPLLERRPGDRHRGERRSGGHHHLADRIIFISHSKEFPTRR